MMAGLFRSETPKVMNVEDLNCEIRQKTCCVDNNVVMDERTTRRKSCGFTKCPSYEHGGCRISLCWTVLFIVVTVFMWYPASSFGMPVPGRPGAGQRGQGRENGGLQKRAIIGDNVVSINPQSLNRSLHPRPRVFCLVLTVENQRSRNDVCFLMLLIRKKCYKI